MSAVHATATTGGMHTVLGDLDAAIRALFERELGDRGIDGAGVSFAAPTEAWAAGLKAPALNLYLYAVAESRAERRVEWEHAQVDGRTIERPPPVLIDVSYVITAWADTAEQRARPALGRARRRLRPPGPARRRPHRRPRRGLGLRPPAAHAGCAAARRGLRRRVLGRARRSPQGVGRLRRGRVVPSRRRGRPGPAGAHADPADAAARPSRRRRRGAAPHVGRGARARTAPRPRAPGSCCPRQAASRSPTPAAASRSRPCARAAIGCRCGRRRAPRPRSRSTVPGGSIDVTLR